MSLVNGKRQAAWFGADPEVETEGAVRGRGLQPADGPGPDVPGPGAAREAWCGPGSGSGCRWAGATSRRSATACGSTPRRPMASTPGRVKDVLEVLDDPPLIDAAMLELTRWMAGYYACSWGQALDAVVPAGVKKQAGTRVGTFLIVPEEVRQARESLDAAGQAGRGAGHPLPVGRAADDRRPLPDGQVRARPDRRAAAAGLRPHGQAPGPAQARPRRWPASPTPTPRRPRPR